MKQLSRSPASIVSLVLGGGANTWPNMRSGVASRRIIFLEQRMCIVKQERGVLRMWWPRRLLVQQYKSHVAKSVTYFILVRNCHHPIQLAPLPQQFLLVAITFIPLLLLTPAEVTSLPASRTSQIQYDIAHTEAIDRTGTIRLHGMQASRKG